MTDLEIAQENLRQAQAIVDNLKEQLEDPFKDLKKAYSEGAKIEYANNVNEFRWNPSHDNKPDWTAPKYRIKGGISIESWHKHKDLIKQWWNGAEIEYKLRDFWGFCEVAPNWTPNFKYRVKNKWKLPEYRDGSKYIVTGTGNIAKTSVSIFTEAGRRRATKVLAERTAEMSKQRDLLEAYRDHLEPTWKDSLKTDAWYLLFHSGEYKTAYRGEGRTIGAVYGSKNTMSQVAKALNTKEITLD